MLVLIDAEAGLSEQFRRLLGKLSGWVVVYHVARHGNSEQFRRLFAVLELQYARDTVAEHELYEAAPYDPSAASVSKAGLDKLVRIEMTMNRTKSAEQARSCMYQQSFSSIGQARNTQGTLSNFSGLSVSRRRGFGRPPG